MSDKQTPEATLRAFAEARHRERPRFPTELQALCENVERVADLRPDQLYALIVKAVEAGTIRAMQVRQNQ